MNFFRKRNNKKGFTLIELLIVIIILAVIAGLALPIYAAQVERSRATEALNSLTGWRQSMLRYFVQNNTYVGATVANLDYNPNLAVGGQTVIFAYTITAQSATGFTLTATRQPTTIVGTVTINEAGVVNRTGVYV